MAMGVGQHAVEFASPDFPGEGPLTWEEMTGIDPDDPFVSSPRVGGFEATAPPTGTGLVHVAAGDTPAQHAEPHWSNLLNLHASTMPWLLILALLFFGLVTVSISGRVGR